MGKVCEVVAAVIQKAMIYLRLLIAVILGTLYIIWLFFLLMLLAIFAPKVFDELFKLPME